MFRDDSVISLPARASAATGTGVSVAAQTAPVAVDQELLRRAEAKRNYVAIYVVWVQGEPGFMLGKTRSPRDIPTQAERFNRRPIDFALFWCREEAADALLARIKAEFKPFFAHGSWYDKIPAIEAIRKVEHEAMVARVRLMTTGQRDALFVDAVAFAMDEQKKLEAAQDPRATRKGGGNTVVQFPKGAPR